MTEFKDRYRLASLVLVNTQNEVLGQLSPLKLSTPWLQEVSELVAQVKQCDGIDVKILRLLTVDDSPEIELKVCYLAEVAQALPSHIRLSPWSGQLDEQPLRLPYAKPGGPAKEVNWAQDALKQAGYGELVDQQQIRTWNLSSIWRLHTAQDIFWLKSVPPFFSHEGHVLKLFANEAVPNLVAADQHRMLLHNLPGEDCYDATLAQMLLMVDTLVDLQWRWKDRLTELFDVGVPDARAAVLEQRITAVISKYFPEMNEEAQASLSAFSESLPARLTALEACGVPASLVHGDYHPGNWRGTGMNLTILDWGDCCVGHPLLDLPALLARAGEHADTVLTRWCNAWQSRLPDADITQAIMLIKPIAAARMAAVFQHFLENIEPDERIYHDADPLFFLRETVQILAESA